MFQVELVRYVKVRGAMSPVAQLMDRSRPLLEPLRLARPAVLLGWLGGTVSNIPLVTVDPDPDLHS
jgi:hypothetical protein